MGIFSKKKNLGRYIIIDFSNEAVNYGLGHSMLKVMYYFNNRNLFNIERYSEIRIKELKREGWIIFDKTAGQFIPKDTQFVPNSRVIAGQLNLNMRLYG